MIKGRISGSFGMSLDKWFCAGLKGALLMVVFHSIFEPSSKLKNEGMLSIHKISLVLDKLLFTVRRW